MFVLIVGGGNVGEGLAQALLTGGHEVAIIEQRHRRSQALAERLPDVHIVHGDGDEPAILETAGISRAQAVAAMTNQDEDNLVACLLGRREYGVPATFARVNNPRNEWLFTQRFGVDLAISENNLDISGLASAVTGAV